MLRDFTKDKFDIIIQAGQSNAQGTAFGPADAPYAVNGRVWYMNEDDTISRAVEKVNGNRIQSNFALSFVREYMSDGRLAEGRDLLIIRAAIGGTGFLDNRWKMSDDLYLHMMEMIRTALSLNAENHLVALLWHQGETDAIHNATYDQHYHHLSTLLQSVRDTFNVPDLPFIAGDFVQKWKNERAEVSIPVSDAIRAVCEDVGNGAFVESDGLLSNDEAGIKKNDIIHFCRNAIYELGVRYYRAYCDIVSKEQA